MFQQTVQPIRREQASAGWAAAPANLPVPHDELHVCRVVLDRPDEEVASLWLLLTDDEQARAAQTRVTEPRRQFIICRAILRMLLAQYLHVHPRQLPLQYGVAGKPSLRPSKGQDWLQFNLSHSADVALYVVAYDRQVGIDIEHIRPIGNMEQIAAQFFSPQEYQELYALPPHGRHEAFFTHWTRGEAHMKASGVGLAGRRVEYGAAVTGDTYTADAGGTKRMPSVPSWSIVDLCPGPGYAGAVAVEGAAPVIRCWRYEPMTTLAIDK